MKTEKKAVGQGPQPPPTPATAAGMPLEVSCGSGLTGSFGQTALVLLQGEEQSACGSVAAPLHGGDQPSERQTTVLWKGRVQAGPECWPQQQ